MCEYFYAKHQKRPLEPLIFQKNTTSKSWRSQKPHYLAEHSQHKHPVPNLSPCFKRLTWHSNPDLPLSTLLTIRTNPLKFRLAILSLIQAPKNQESKWQNSGKAEPLCHQKQSEPWVWVQLPFSEKLPQSSFSRNISLPKGKVPFLMDIVLSGHNKRSYYSIRLFLPSCL